ncbi:MAG: diacylglycerol kinase [Gammaproteobacteria bacterium]|nr:diacylglycerol kinase [Gammaproteobacteria bacterium]MDH5593402.1 diacylglycerol kinase [Gammaproteobacteria bacterium]MDH5613965.1 diacylglycerol kinase [Gammaproteobacteria bacterium]
MANQNNTGMKRIWRATGFSWNGLKAAFTHEAAFRQELFAFVILAPLAFYLGNTSLQIAVMIGSLFLVLITELLNSAIEAVVDRTGKEHHELAGRAKDVASAAVFLSLVNAVVVWIIILIL